MSLQPITSKNCESCGKAFSRKASGVSRESTIYFSKKKYCSRQCAAKVMGSVKRVAWNKGLPAPWAVGEKNVNWIGGYWCADCGKKLPSERKRDRNNTRCRDCATKFYKGENSWNWRGGISKYHRMSYEYIKWAKSVYAKDHYTCAMCHKHCSKDIQAHHILSWKDTPELRFNTDNGITLCFECHLTTRGREAYLAPLFYNVLATRQSERFVWSN